MHIVCKCNFVFSSMRLRPIHIPASSSQFLLCSFRTLRATTLEQRIFYKKSSFGKATAIVTAAVPLVWIWRVADLQTGSVMTIDPEKVKQFYRSVKDNDIEAVEKTLDEGEINVDYQNPKNGRTALHVAAHRGRLDIVQLLVNKFHATINIKDDEGIIPLQLATDRYHMKVVKFLIDNGSELREYAARFLNEDDVEELFAASEANNIEKVIELINGGVDVNSEDNSNHLCTALEVAADRGYFDLVRCLVDDLGANIQHQDGIGECAYHKAANRDYDNIVNFLIERGFRDPYEFIASMSDSETE